MVNYNVLTVRGKKAVNQAFMEGFKEGFRAHITGAEIIFIGIVLSYISAFLYDSDKENIFNTIIKYIHITSFHFTAVFTLAYVFTIVFGGWA